jgi:hypothetical protein
VSVLVVSRYLRPGYGHNAEFIKKRLQRDYNPRICPVTGGDCGLTSRAGGHTVAPIWPQ